jgi:hypothetical protein
VEPEDPFEQVNDLPIAEIASFRPAPVEGGIEQPPPPVAKSTPLDPVHQSAETSRSTPMQATPNTADFIPHSTPMSPDGSSTGVSAKTFEDGAQLEPNRLKKTHRPTRTILVEKDARIATQPASLIPFSNKSVNSRPGWPNPIEKEFRQEKKEPPALETRKESMAPISRDPQTEPTAPKRKPPLENSRTQMTQPRKSTVQVVAPPPPPPAEPKEVPTLYPSPLPLPPETRQPKRPRLVIGRLHVEVVPSPEQTPSASSTAKPARRIPSPTPGRQPVHSKLRFGLGQL